MHAWWRKFIHRVRNDWNSINCFSQNTGGSTFFPILHKILFPKKTSEKCLVICSWPRLAQIWIYLLIKMMPDCYIHGSGCQHWSTLNLLNDFIDFLLKSIRVPVWFYFWIIFLFFKVLEKNFSLNFFLNTNSYTIYYCIKHSFFWSFICEQLYS